MFVLDCDVVNSEFYKYNPNLSKIDSNINSNIDSRLQNLEPCDTFTQNDYMAVRCNKCSQLVGVIDNEEIIHFFNVIASLA